MLLRLLNSWRDARERARKDADLLTFLRAITPIWRLALEVDPAARSGTGPASLARVAVRIARETGIRVGEKVADRYAATAAEAIPDRRAEMRRREILDGLVEISAVIADVTRDQEGVAQAACGRVWQLQEFRPEPAVLEAGRELRGAVEALAAEPAECAAALSIGIYPLRTELAGQALQRFRAALLVGSRAGLRGMGRTP